MEQFLVPAGEGASEYMEKKSRFLGLIVPVTTEAEARARLEAVKKQEYDARHNCWAYILHSGQKRYSDDGEPQGTAGQPILNVLEREGVQDVLCVVTRYFGGILLGAAAFAARTRRPRRTRWTTRAFPSFARGAYCGSTAPMRSLSA